MTDKRVSFSSSMNSTMTTAASSMISRASSSGLGVGSSGGVPVAAGAAHGKVIMFIKDGEKIEDKSLISDAKKNIVRCADR